MKEQYIPPAAEKKPVAGVKEIIGRVNTEETGQQKITTPDKTPPLPAPFYDELHFADYE